MAIDNIEEYIKQRDIHSVEFGFGDINGTMRGKIVTARHFLKNIEESTDLARAPFAWDVQCGVYDDIEFANFTNGFPDLKARPILSTFREIPWRRGTAFVLCEPVDKFGTPFEITPRFVLQKVLKKVDLLGYRLQTGAELEFYLLDSNRKPVFDGVQCYSVNKGAEVEFFLENVRNSLEDFDVKIEATHVEYGPSQLEIIPEYTDPLTLADNSLIIKTVVKQLAKKSGLIASFMPKIWDNESGSGYHVHQSLWDEELKVNLFEKNEELANQYLSGLVHFAPEFLALGSPSVNAYKRLRENSFAPVDASWADDNRSVAVRSLFGLGDASRIEYRTGSSDGNPYLIIAASIASGLFGIENKLQADENLKPLPRSLREAVELFKSTEQSSEFFGREFVKLFSLLGNHEALLYEQSITDWEINRYLEEA
jgi:glutamine synthetase